MESFAITNNTEKNENSNEILIVDVDKLTGENAFYYFYTQNKQYNSFI